ncbi:MAG: hypothetical protein M3Z75_15775 [Actinomycetota bacterium]|nr:hypothetical protein [Actinomycetota bacterium]
MPSETRQASPEEQDTDMAEQPRHPDISDAPGTGSGGPAAARPRRRAVLVIAVVVLALALMIALHVTGVVGASTNG